MSTSIRRAGFTLIELLVVVAIIVLLISILLPSLKDAREQGKMSTCLSNMKSVSEGIVAYSTEDRREHAVPVQQQMVTAGFDAGIPDGGGPGRYWALRTILPFAYGGRTAQKPFNGGTVLMDDNGRWAARTKPLNRYLYHFETSDSTKMPLYRCPSDQGYPNNPFVWDAPFQTMADVPCYDMIGNSYRFNFAGIFFPSGNGSRGEISVGPYGHRMSTLPNPGRQTLLMEPLFYSMTIQAAVNGIPDELLLRGWHGRVMTCNVGFVDGSARQTRVMNLYEWDGATLAKMNYGGGDPLTFLRRGQTWQMDCYPTPAAWIPKFIGNRQQEQLSEQDAFSGRTGWPFDGHQSNMK